MPPMGLLDQPGDLGRTPLAALLLELLNMRADGVLEVAHGGGTSRLWFRAGQPVGAQVATGLRPLGLVLLQAGKIDVDALSRSLSELATTRRPQGELLVEMGAVSREDVEAALAEQQGDYVSSIAALEAGRYAFDASRPVPEWTRGIRLSPLRTIIDALERPQAAQLVTSALRPVALGGVRLASGYAQVAPGFGWDPAEQQLVARLAQPISIEFYFSARQAVALERARAILAGLLLLGLAISVEESPRATGDTSPGLTLAGVVAASLLREELGVEHRAVVEPPPIAQTPAPIRAPVTATASIDERAPTPAPGWTPLPFRTPPPGGSATPGSPAVPLKRSDPAEARARRQRLLAKAMLNMGVNPTERPATGPNATPLPGTVRAVPAASAASPADEALRKALLQIAPRARERSYFARLGLPETAGRDEVKSAFLSLARQFHPDLFGGAAMADLQDQVRDFFSAVNEAYQGLSDDKRRAQHLEALRSGGATDPRRADSARLDYQKGEVCLRTRDHVRARGFLESAVRADPRPEYQAALAQSFLDIAAGRDLARAKELVTAALASPGLDGPGKDRVHYVAGLLAQISGSNAEAERQFKAAVAANPKHTEAVRELKAMEGWRGRGRR
jgi:hypothetical protein